MTVKQSSIGKVVNQFRQQLDELRSRIGALKGEQGSLLNAALSPEEREQQIIAAVGQGASRYRRRLTSVAADFLRHTEEPRASSISPANGPAATWEHACYFGGDRFAADLVALAGELVGDTPALTREDREQRLRDIEAELFALEQQEESAVTDLEGAGLTVDRRPDADPRAVLAVQ